MITHWPWLAVRCRSRWMVGEAMATIVWSMNVMETARIIAIITSREPVLFCSGVLVGPAGLCEGHGEMSRGFGGPGTPGEITSSRRPWGHCTFLTGRPAGPLLASVHAHQPTS